MINLHSFLFLLLALVACVFAAAVVVSSNIVRMACYLIVSLAAVAGLFFLTGADFVGAAQLMVYVGGTMVLLVFGVMLTARGPFVEMKTGAAQWIMAIVAGGGLFAMLLSAAISIPAWAGPAGNKEQKAAIDKTSTKATEEIGLGLMGVRTDRLGETDTDRRGGMSGYLLAFEIISVHLAVVLIGAAYLARARRRVPPRLQKIADASES